MAFWVRQLQLCRRWRPFQYSIRRSAGTWLAKNLSTSGGIWSSGKSRGAAFPTLPCWQHSRRFREAFLPSELAEFAYLDRALPIEKGQTISQPYIVALMTAALELES